MPAHGHSLQEQASAVERQSAIPWPLPDIQHISTRADRLGDAGPAHRLPRSAALSSGAGSPLATGPWLPVLFVVTAVVVLLRIVSLLRALPRLTAPAAKAPVGKVAVVHLVADPRLQPRHDPRSADARRAASYRRGERTRRPEDEASRSAPLLVALRDHRRCLDSDGSPQSSAGRRQGGADHPG